MSIELQRWKYISNKAYFCWFEFKRQHGERGFGGHSILVPPQPGRKQMRRKAKLYEAAIAFFDTCCQIQPQCSDDGQVDFRPQYRNRILNDALPSVTWLWAYHAKQGSRKVPVAVFRNDVFTKAQHLSAGSYWQRINKIIFHEAGHVVLHWPDLAPQGRQANSGQTFVARASPIEEREAWAFANIILALCTQDMIQDAPPLDRDWECWPYL